MFSEATFSLTEISTFLEKGISDIENRFQNMEEFSTEVKKLLRELN